MMTAFVSAETAIRSTTLDADDYLVKPFEVETLKQLIVRTLHKHASAQEPAAAPDEARPEPLSPEAVPMLGNSQAMQEVYKNYRQKRGAGYYDFDYRRERDGQRAGCPRPAHLLATQQRTIPGH